MNVNHLESFKKYYKLMTHSGECDPTYPAMNYVADRLELNMSQRYWLSFLYGCTYCVPTTYYIFNEFPDMENVNLKRMERWWNKNKSKLYFQYDRARVKNYNIFTKCVKSYINLIGTDQEKTFSQFNQPSLTREQIYDNVYKFTRNIYYFGRFTLFNYLECLNEITNLKMEPSTINLDEAESSCNGLCYIIEAPEQVTLHHSKPTTPKNYPFLHTKLSQLKSILIKDNPEIDVNYWNIETALCAYKKLIWGSRYLGYYIDRMLSEIKLMETNIPEGVDWSILWDFRKEYFNHSLLGELNGWNGITKSRMNIFKDTGSFKLPEESYNFMPTQLDPYTRKVQFNNIGDIYNQ